MLPDGQGGGPTCHPHGRRTSRRVGLPGPVRVGRSVAYLVTTVPVAAVCALALWPVALAWIALAARLADGRAPEPVAVLFTVAGSVAALALGLPAAVALGALERRRLRLVDPRPLLPGHRPAPGGPVSWLRTRYAEPATWRELAHAAVLAVALPAAWGVVALLVLTEVTLLAGPWLAGRGDGPVAVGVAEVASPGEALPYAIVGVLLLPLVTAVPLLLARAQPALARALLAGGDGPALREVARSRTRLVDAFDAERRRIERDLHDGAQLRLTSLTLQIGTARLDLPADSPAAASLARAHEQAKDLMVDLRELVRGIHPRALTDLGLTAAVRELADASPVPVRVSGGPADAGRDPAGRTPQRLPERVEGAAYFVVSEALANVTKHAGATRADVLLSADRDRLVVEVRDDGRGGADPVEGSGLTGLADRVAAVDGRLLLSSPPGGPTVVRAELPCRR